MQKFFVAFFQKRNTSFLALNSNRIQTSLRSLTAVPLATASAAADAAAVIKNYNLADANGTLRYRPKMR
jgi:uncharacterized iron-regulated protein